MLLHQEKLATMIITITIAIAVIVIVIYIFSQACDGKPDASARRKRSIEDDVSVVEASITVVPIPISKCVLIVNLMLIVKRNLELFTIYSDLQTTTPTKPVP